MQFGDQLLEGYVSLLVAPPGIGKSTLTIQYALAVAAGMNQFAGYKVHKPGNTWIYNNEDDRNEMERRIVAAAETMNINLSSIADKIFLDTGDERELIVAQTNSHGVVMQRPDVEQCIEQIKRNKIKLLIVDPFAETFHANENSNDEMGQIARMYRRIAKEAGCAVQLVHHMNKGGEAGSLNAIRGAGSVAGVARVVSTVFNMSEQDAKDMSVDDGDRYQYIRLDGAKANLSLVTDKAKWFKRVSVQLSNGDSVGSLEPWEPPSVWDRVNNDGTLYIQRQVQSSFNDGDPWRNSPAAKDKWVGHLIADRFGFDVKTEQKALAEILTEWMKNGVLVTAPVRKNGREVIGLQTGDWIK